MIQIASDAMVIHALKLETIDQGETNNFGGTIADSWPTGYRWHKIRRIFHHMRRLP